MRGASGSLKTDKQGAVYPGTSDQVRRLPSSLEKETIGRVCVYFVCVSCNAWPVLDEVWFPSWLVSEHLRNVMSGL